MTAFGRPVLAPPFHAGYWEQRARRFAGQGSGLAAVCSYGMPGFYNRAIELTQRLALGRELIAEPGETVLDIGCGIGRWSLRLAAAGARVTGIDLSPTMVSLARRRSLATGLGSRCRFKVADLCQLDLEQRFSRIVGVTVLQHICENEQLDEALVRLRHHLLPRGRLVMLEAAPDRENRRCDSSTFKARTFSDYLARLSRAGFVLEAARGVDPAPFKTWLLPHYADLSRPVARLLLAASVALSLPIDLACGRQWLARSWHKVMIVRVRDDQGAS